MVAYSLMVAYACLRHWYMGMMFFAPIPLVGLFVWMSGRRHAAEGDGPDDPHGSSPAGIAG
jgi:hypothetical protein